MSLLDPPATDLRWASPALVIEMRPTGLSIPKYRNAPELRVELDGLRAIERLARGAREPEVDPASADLVEALADRGLLRDESAPSRPTEAHVPTGTAASFDDVLILPTPLLLGVDREGFEIVDHDGRLQVRLSADQLVAASAFRLPRSVADARDAHLEEMGNDALDETAFNSLVGELLSADVLVRFDPDAAVHASQSRQAERMRDAIRRQALVHQEFDRIEAEHDARGGPPDRIRVIGVHSNFAGPPQSLGLLIAAAKAHEDGALEHHYDFRPRLLWDADRLRATAGQGPSIFLFSNYLWSSAENLAFSALVKEVDPRNVTIHGGPDTPKYPADAAAWFAEHRHVDICVHGEGEATLVELLERLRGAIGPDGADLRVLADVQGLSFRTADGIEQTPGRDRIADVDAIPSPILTGLFDGFIPAGRGGGAGLVLETNRGCPYGCTFCDWGSATASRIRKFDLDRVFAEITWCAENGFGIGIADANFGIFERDVEIAEHIAALKAEHGYPRVVGNNYAKNTVKHLSRIIEIFTDAGITAEGKMSMQTFDTDTLLTIRRKNIKVEKYTDLSIEFRRNELPLVVELMMGLPGATPETFMADLQACIDRDVRAAVYPTVLLPNSPMNEPSYREENQIVARPGEVVMSTASYTRDDFDFMQDVRLAFYVFENFGVLRQVTTFVRAEAGIRQIDFHRRFIEDVTAEPARYPAAAVALQVIPDVMVPPVSWSRFVDDVRRYLVDVIGLPDDAALETVLHVQHALLPARGRSFPVELELAHDYAGWHQLVAAARGEGHFDDWPDHVPSLSEMPPARFVVHDPLGTCESALGYPCDSFLYFENSWDLSSPVSRPRQAVADEAIS